jgi:predicted Na+-dependent transporter
MSSSSRVAAVVARLADQIAPLAVLAAVLALATPSRALARESDLLLAGLVLLAGLGIAPARLIELRHRWPVLVALSVVPFLVLGAVAWALSRGFHGTTRDGILTLRLSLLGGRERWGLVALAGGDAVLALGVLAGSLVTSALLGPLLVGVPPTPRVTPARPLCSAGSRSSLSASPGRPGRTRLTAHRRACRACATGSVHRDCLHPCLRRV